LVESITAILFAGVAYHFSGPIHIMFWLVLVSLGMIIATYDMAHRIIPIRPLIAFAVTALLLGFSYCWCYYRSPSISCSLVYFIREMDSDLGILSSWQ
jgi:hypothetical protein